MAKQKEPQAPEVEQKEPQAPEVEMVQKAVLLPNGCISHWVDVPKE